MLLCLLARQGAAEPEPDSTAIADAVRSLKADHDRATSAVYVLRAGGARAAIQIRDAWPTLTPLGQKRALPALSELARTHDAALEVLMEATRSADDELHDRAWSALRRLGPPGLRALVQLLPDPEVGERAAAVLARTNPDFALEPLLEALGDDGGANRAGLRHALGTAVERAHENAEARLRSWIGTEPNPRGVASAALALVSLDGYEALIASFVEYAAPKARDFDSQWRLLHCANAAGPSPEIDRWLRAELAHSEPWMLRRAAVDAMTARGQRSEARLALHDPYPRVRAHAAAALSGDARTLPERATLARRDPWPLVRAQAVTSLRTEGEAVPVIVASVDDSMSTVREAAIQVLASSDQDQGWDRIQRRLRDRDEWPRVTAAAIEYVEAHCRTDAVDSLLRVVMRAAPSGALTEDLNNAARAIEALQSLGSPDAEAALALLRTSEGVPPTLKIALERPQNGGARCVWPRR